MAPLTAKDKCFNKTFEAGKGSKCLANDQEFPLTKWKKNTLNNFIRKLDKKKCSRPARKRSARTWGQIHE